MLEIWRWFYVGWATSVFQLEFNGNSNIEKQTMIQRWKPDVSSMLKFHHWLYVGNITLKKLSKSINSQRRFYVRAWHKINVESTLKFHRWLYVGNITLKKLSKSINSQRRFYVRAWHKINVESTLKFHRWLYVGNITLKKTFKINQFST